MEIFSLEYGFGDFSFEKWRFFLLKICSWRFFLWNIYFGDWTFEEKFNEDLFMEISPWRFILEIFPLKFWKFLLKICSLEIFPLEYGFGDFSFWRFVRGDFSLKIYSGDFSIEFLKNFKKICSWRFFLWNMVLEIFPLKNGDFSFWRFVCGDFSLKTYS